MACFSGGDSYHTILSDASWAGGFSGGREAKAEPYGGHQREREADFLPSSSRWCELSFLMGLFFSAT